ncbi:MAG: hypothetical protein JHD16_04920 [Solirubrobacteraceae bacterium]|nr:hypothetical protein [Solirubrobacteraceae bacterium]
MLLSTPITIRRALLPVGLAVAALVAPAGAFGAACPKLPTSQAFLKFGDTADYTLLPKANFESGTTGWSLFNARTVAGNETGGVLPGSRSLALGTGWVSGPTIVSTPEFCVGTEHPHFRYMLKANGAVGLLATLISYRTSNGATVQKQVASNVSTNLFPGKWKPSELNPLSVRLPISDGQTLRVRILFVTPASMNGAGYQIDNVMIDPYRRG